MEIARYGKIGFKAGIMFIGVGIDAFVMVTVGLTLLSPQDVVSTEV